MIVWSHYRASFNDPAFMEERYVSSYSDTDSENIDIDFKKNTDATILERKKLDIAED